jgi:hypothetical protein
VPVLLLHTDIKARLMVGPKLKFAAVHDLRLRPSSGQKLNFDGPFETARVKYSLFHAKVSDLDFARYGLGVERYPSPVGTLQP